MALDCRGWASGMYNYMVLWEEFCGWGYVMVLVLLCNCRTECYISLVFGLFSLSAWACMSHAHVDFQ